jgi:murein DD-endopeptidase MepM/ murein hydrolase activator NlpD
MSSHPPVRFLLLTLVVVLAGCSPLSQVKPSATPLSVTTDTPTVPAETPPPTQEPTTTTIQESPTPELTLTPEVAIPTIIETGDVLRFAFPTQGQQPVSIWRPPLYPVPWGLGLNDHFLFIRPIAADVVNWALPNYRYGGIFTDTDIIHTGIDIDAPIDTPVYAAGAGTIRWAGFGLYMNDSDKDDPYGLAVAIEHDFGYQGQKLFTIYAHLDRIDVTKGQHVNVGEQIGVVGNTGNTTGPHLHFEVRVSDNNYYTSRNPELWLSPPQGWGVLVGRIMWSGGSLLEKKNLIVKSLSTEQTWEVITYGPLAVNQDDNYRENLVLSDLPQGDYEVSITFYGRKYNQTISIQPGAVTYLTFQGVKGFLTSIPPTPAPDGWFLTPIPKP